MNPHRLEVTRTNRAEGALSLMRQIGSIHPDIVAPAAVAEGNDIGFRSRLHSRNLFEGAKEVRLERLAASDGEVQSGQIEIRDQDALPVQAGVVGRQIQKATCE